MNRPAVPESVIHREGLFTGSKRDVVMPFGQKMHHLLLAQGSLDGGGLGVVRGQRRSEYKPASTRLPGWASVCHNALSPRAQFAGPSTELRRVGSGKRMTFGNAGEATLSQWMADNARVCWVEKIEPWTLESQLISQLDRPLNLDQNRHNAFHARLKELRAQARQRARALPVSS
ncbi:GIY-YIG nuclease family protein [Streptomyces sp. NPDC004393]